MKQKLWIVPAGAALGLGCGGLVNTLGGGNWKTLSAPLLTLGEGLRRLSLSGFWGNLGAWGIVLLISALPLAALARALGRADFDGEGVELCGRTALACRMAAQATVVLAVSGNLVQLAVLEQIHTTHFSLTMPLVSLMLSAGLMLLCRLLERGRELQEDSDSII